MSNVKPITIIILVQALEREPQFLLMLFEISGKLWEVKHTVPVLVTGGHYFLSRHADG